MTQFFRDPMNRKEKSPLTRKAETRVVLFGCRISQGYGILWGPSAKAVLGTALEKKPLIFCVELTEIQQKNALIKRRSFGNYLTQRHNCLCYGHTDPKLCVDMSIAQAFFLSRIRIAFTPTLPHVPSIVNTPTPYTATFGSM
jgi:hypothetical protein